MEASQEEQKGGAEVAKPTVEKLPFTTYREYFDDSYKVGAGCEILQLGVVRVQRESPIGREGGERWRVGRDPRQHDIPPAGRWPAS